MDKSPTSQACALAKVSRFFSLNTLYWQVLKQEKIGIKFRGFQTLLWESLFYSKLMTRWTFPLNIVSVFFSNVKLSFVNHCVQVAVPNSDFFQQKMTTSISNKEKKFPDGKDRLDWWIFCVLCVYYLFKYWPSQILSPWESAEPVFCSKRKRVLHKWFFQPGHL